MAWPTVAEIKAQFDKLNQTSFDTAKLPQARLAAINHIKGRLALQYDTSGWATTTPPMLYDICFLLVYCWFANRVHTGSKLTESDQAAQEACKSAKELLDMIALGGAKGMELLDSSDAVISRANFYSTNLVHKRTSTPIFTMKPEEEQEVEIPETGEEWD